MNVDKLLMGFEKLAILILIEYIDISRNSYTPSKIYKYDYVDVNDDIVYRGIGNSSKMHKYKRIRRNLPYMMRKINRFK